MDIEKYINKVGATRDNSHVVKALDQFFSLMKTNDEVGTSQLVQFLKDEGITLPDKGATDIPIQAAKQCNAVIEGNVEQRKQSGAKYSRIVFVRV